MKEKFEKLRDLAANVSDTTVEMPINYKIYLQDLTALMNRYGDNNEKKENENESNCSK